MAFLILARRILSYLDLILLSDTACTLCFCLSFDRQKISMIAPTLLGLYFVCACFAYSVPGFVPVFIFGKDFLQLQVFYLSRFSQDSIKVAAEHLQASVSTFSLPLVTFVYQISKISLHSRGVMVKSL